jgi:hypothetical protein
MVSGALQAHQLLHAAHPPAHALKPGWQHAFTLSSSLLHAQGDVAVGVPDASTSVHSRHCSYIARGTTPCMQSARAAGYESVIADRSAGRTASAGQLRFVCMHVQVKGVVVSNLPGIHQRRAAAYSYVSVATTTSNVVTLCSVEPHSRRRGPNSRPCWRGSRSAHICRCCRMA